MGDSAGSRKLLLAQTVTHPPPAREEWHYRVMIPFPASKLPARNEPCSCGSGRKFKHCCGAVIPVRAAPQPRLRPATARSPDYTVQAAAGTVHLGRAVSLDAARSCGMCTTCCAGWLTCTVLGQEIKPGAGCRFRGAGSCTIYEERPAIPCRSFFCAWRLEGNPFPESFRPDRLGVIIVLRQWRDRPGYELIPAGRDPDATLIDWISEYSTATGIPFLYYIDGFYRAIGVPEFQEEMREKAVRGELPSLHGPGARLRLHPTPG